MPRIYLSRRGNIGASFGCLGTLILILFYLLMAALFFCGIGLVAGCFVVAVLGLLGDIALQVFPRYRTRRKATPIKWPKAMVDGIIQLVAPSRMRPYRPAFRRGVPPRDVAPIEAARRPMTRKPATNITMLREQLTTILMREGWTNLTIVGNRVLRITDPGDRQTLIILDGTSSGDYVDERTVAECLKAPKIHPSDRTMVVSYGRFEDRSISIAAQVNMRLMDGGDLGRLGAVIPK